MYSLAVRGFLTHCKIIIYKKLMKVMQNFKIISVLTKYYNNSTSNIQVPKYHLGLVSVLYLVPAE